MSTSTSNDSPLGLSSGRAILDALRTDLLNDNLSEETLNNYLDNVKCLQAKQNSRLQNYSQLIDEIGFCKYLVTGTEPQRSEMCSNADLYTGAIHALYQNDVETAVNLFKDSENRLLSLPKELPENPVAAYYYILALLKSGRDTEKLEGLKMSREIPPIMGLLANLQSEDKSIIISGINGAKGSAKPLEQQFLFLASRYSKLGNLQGYNNLEHIPNLPIMRLECSPFLHLEETEAQQLKETFGGESVIASLDKKENWTSTINDLELLLKIPGQVTNPRLRSRVKFIFYDNSILGLREQKLQPDGSWGEEKLLSYSQYIEGGYSFMDENDEKIVLALKDYNRNREHALYRNEAEVVMPFPIGSDRVYGPHGQLEITAEKPKVRFRLHIDRIIAETNVDVDTEGKVFPCKVASDEAGNCRVISTNPQQRRILELIFKSQDLPITAAESLADLGEKMRGVIDVDTSALQNLKQAPTLQGTGRIIVQIKPDPTRNSFGIEWQALPVDAGEVRFTPGDGAQSIWRPMRMESHTACSVTSSTRWTISTTLRIL